MKPLIKAALLLVAGACGLACAHSQQPVGTGSLAGKLTDTHSAALENITVTLRNAATGAEQQTRTAHSGKYHFEGLVEGEYTLSAAGPLGVGGVAGIYIASGHEAQVQTAIEFDALAATVATHDAGVPELHNPSTLENPLPAERFRAWVTAHPAPSVISPVAITMPQIVFADEELLSLPLVGTPSITRIAPRAAPVPQIVVAQAASLPTSRQSLDAAQIQALPIAGRDWRNFVIDGADATAVAADGGRSPLTVGNVPGITVDGVRTQLAFGAATGGQTRNQASSLMGAGSGESAVRELGMGGSSEAMTGAAGGSRANVTTQRGGDHMHGQAFIFDRQNMLGAQNLFTQLIKETAPATLAAIPSFTTTPFTPGDREALWGAGIGGSLHKQGVFWFAALDGFERNDPAVSMVKHPENFFAQPSNDQMQLLSAQLGIGSADPVSAGVGAYSKLLESLTGLLGSANRSASQWIGFGRVDWNAGERHRFTLESSGARVDSPGGGFSRASEAYGTHSFGSMRASEEWTLGRWEAFVTPNLLAVTQGSFGHQVQSALPETPSTFEQSLNINAWGQLPQIVVDSRYGFTIGNPARFGRGNYPDERLYFAQQQLNWVHGQLMVKSGMEISHNRDATTRLRNQTGTYYYSTVEDFASDALAFGAFGLSGQLNPTDQHNCDQTGKAWRDSSGVLHGLGYLPCYSYYSQTMGPTDWWLSTNDWAGYVTSQWQPTKRTALTLAMRWELEQLPGSLASLRNPDLPLTQRLPRLGGEWGPRAALAWGTGENRWPVVRLGYGMYFARSNNALLESALTQTGSLKGDLNFFMRPTDNLNAGGAPPFPYVLQGEPASVVKPGAVEFGTDFKNGEVHQAELAVEEALPGRLHVEASAVASLGRRLPVTFDANIDPASNPKTITYAVIDGNGSGPIKTPQITVPFYASWPSPYGDEGRLNPNYQQVSELFSRANSTYEAANLRVSRSARSLTLRARYTYAHAADWNPDETSQATGPSVFDPTDFRQEYGTSDLDVRHSASVAAIVDSKWKLKNPAGQIVNGWMLSGTGSFRSGLPYTMHTSGTLAKEFESTGAAVVGLSTGMNGYGGDNRVYGIGRNPYRYPATWKADLRVTRRFNLGQMRQLDLMAESFNLFNHQNVTELETTGYTIESGTVNAGMPRLNFLTGLKSGQTEFGMPLSINATNFYRARQIQFGVRMRF